MRKLFLFGGAAALAYMLGRGKAGEARQAAARHGHRRIRLTDILEVLLAPRWLKPVLLARAIAHRREPTQRG